MYEGSTKHVWRPVEREDRLWFQYDDSYSMFGWRPMPDLIAGRAKSLTVLASFFFEHLSDPISWKQLPVSPALKSFRSDWLEARWAHLTYSHVLAEHGLPSHYQGLVAADGTPLTMAEAVGTAGSAYIEVLPAVVTRPEAYTLLGQKVFYYGPPGPATRRLLPLEVVFHLGIRQKDHLRRRLEADPGYLEALDIKKIPEDGQLFDRPLLEFFPRIEPPHRRRLLVQEALVISGLTGGQFEELIETAYNIALALYALFSQRRIELWQGKLEFAISAEGLMLVDCLEPDELLITCNDKRLSKDAVEMFYRGTPWEAAVQEAKTKAEAMGRRDWQDMCRSALRAEPEPLPSELRTALDHLYPALANHVLRRNLFDGVPPLDDVVTRLPP